MCQLYPEQLPDVVKDKARKVAEYFQSERFATKKELTKMSQLSAECAKVFPPDFASVDPEEVVRAVSNEMKEHTTRPIIITIVPSSITIIGFRDNIQEIICSIHGM